MTHTATLLDSAQSDADRPTLAEAQVYCRRVARGHYENFTVASWLLPKHLHQHFANIYAYCRTADDLADEGATDRRLAALDTWEQHLRDCYSGRAVHPIFVALAETIAEFEIPIDPLADLLIAFRQDQHVSHYATTAALLGYCRFSANPVGRLVLHLGRCCDQYTAALSDSICTGLQLVNFCQDVARDWRDRQRIYLPQETLRQFGGDEQTLVADVARGHASKELRGAIAHETERAAEYLQEGWPLVDRVASELRLEVELFVRGGLAVVETIRRQDYDVLRRRPVVTRGKKLQLFAQAWWRRHRSA